MTERAYDCKVCGDPACTVAATMPPEPAPLTVLLLRDVDGSESLWFYIPEHGNWNYYEIERDGSWCWEDLQHQVAKGATLTAVPFDHERFYWGCAGVADFYGGTLCAREWTPTELADLVPGCSGPVCHVCGDDYWPAPRRREAAEVTS